MPVVYPEKIYDFTGFSAQRPADQIPGDRLDAQFDNHRTAILALANAVGALLRSDGKLQNGIVDRSTLADDLATAISEQFRQNIAGDIASAAGSSAIAQASALAVSKAQDVVLEKATEARADLEAIQRQATPLLSRINENLNLQSELEARIDGKSVVIDNFSNDAEYWAQYSFSWGQVSWEWAEHMPGTIPPNILATMGISGEHWSSRWWANQSDLHSQAGAGSAADAAQAAEDAAQAAQDAADAAQDAADAAEALGDLYLGAHPSNPTTDNDGDPLQEGALYYNSVTDILYVFDGLTWNAVSTPSGAGMTAAAVSFAPAGGISATNVQLGMQELDTEKLGDSPHDGAIYGRKDGVWVMSVAATIDWGSISGKPSTFPPSPHVHPISDVTNLQTELNNRATDAELAAEASTRASADTTLQTNINTVSTGLATEVTNRTNADTNLQNQIDTHTTAIAGKVPEAPNDGKLYGRRSLVWEQVIPGATVGLNAPSSPNAGQLWWDSDTGNFYVYYTDANSSQWVQVNARPLTSSSIFTSDVPPTLPPDNALWFETDSGNLYIYYNDGNSKQWVQLNSTPSSLNYVKRDGDTMTGALNLTGNTSPQLKIAPTSTQAQIHLDAPTGSGTAITLDKGTGAATSNVIQGQTSGVARWSMELGDNVAPESTGNAGSAFRLSRHADNGSYIDSPLTIDRVYGIATFPNNVTISPGNNGDPVLNLAKTFGAHGASVAGYSGSPITAGGLRWQFSLGDANVESGSNVGSNCSLYRYSDAGAFLGTAWTVLRSNGLMRVDSSRLMSYGSGNGPSVCSYDVASPLCTGFWSSGTLYQAYGSCDGNGVPAVTWGMSHASGYWIKGIGNFGPYDNGAGARLYSFQGNTYMYSTTADGWIYWCGAGSQNMSLPPNGYLDIIGATPTKAGAGQWAARSDRRIKRDIRDFKLGLDEILKLRPRRYKYKKEAHASCGTQEQVGLIAQEVEDIWPDLVFRRDRDAMGEIELDQMRVIDITAIQFGLVNAVKELKSMLDDAFKRIEELETAR